MRTFYFDTSAINYLFDDPQSSFIKQAVQKTAVVYPSVFNIAELASTSNKERRFGLLKLTKNISGDYRPLAMPGDLLKRSLVAVKVWANDMNHSMGPEWEGVWIALNDPSQIDEEAYQEIIEWKRKQEEWYQKMHGRGRHQMQEGMRRIPPDELAALTSSFARAIRYYPLEREFVVNFVHDMALHSGAGVIVDHELIQRIIKHSEHWRFFLASMVYGMYVHSVRITHYGKRHTPGSIDTQQAIYLAACDIFITADHQQYRMLRLVVPFGHKKRRIWTYSRFVQWLRQIATNW